MSELELRNKAEIEAIELTEDEMKAAIQEAKIKKWYHIKNNPYWLKKEFGNKVGRAVWVVLLLVASSCAGSYYVVRQNELMIRGISNDNYKTIILSKQLHKK